MQQEPESGTFTNVDDDGHHEELTEQQRSALPPLSRIELVEKEQFRIRQNMDEMRGDVKAILTGVGTLSNKLESTLERVEGQGWTRWTVRVSAMSDVIKAAGILWIGWLVWLAAKNAPLP